MSPLVDMVSRVQQLQSLLTPQPVSGSTSTATAGSTFASALTQAQSLLSGSVATDPATGAGSSAHTGQDVVAAARRYLGAPYVWGGTDPSVGLDCSGLVQRVYGDLGIQLPRVSGDQARAGQPVASLARAQPGDVLAFGHPVHHVGIYIGNGQMIDAPRPGERVKVERVYETPAAIRRLVPDASSTASSAPTGSAPTGSGLGSGLGSLPYAGLFSQVGAKYGLSPALLAAVAKVESGYDPRAVSSAGAQGLMQLMPGTAAGLGVDPLDPAQAIDGAARLLRRNLSDFGSLPLALAAYNAGPGAVRRYGGIPPYAETQAYVQKVQAALTALTPGVSA